jgi:hypothetical protein
MSLHWNNPQVSGDEDFLTSIIPKDCSETPPQLPSIFYNDLFDDQYFTASFPEEGQSQLDFLPDFDENFFHQQVHDDLLSDDTFYKLFGEPGQLQQHEPADPVVEVADLSFISSEVDNSKDEQLCNVTLEELLKLQKEGKERETQLEQMINDIHAE